MMQMTSVTGQDGSPNFDNYFDKLKKSLKEKREKFESERKYFHIDYVNFKTMFFLHACDILLKKNQNIDFEIDKDNEQAIIQLYCYLVGNRKFKGNFHKGIMLVGNIGSGKTLIMDTFLEICKKTIYKDARGSKFLRVHSKEVAAKMKNVDNDKTILYNKLFVDDIGKESKTANDYGNVINPVSDLFSARYDKAVLTFATANYSKDSFEKFYGNTIADRFVEMFNIIKVEGKSRRN